MAPPIAWCPGPQARGVGMKRDKHKSTRPPKAKAEREVLRFSRNHIALPPHPSFILLAQVLARAEVRAQILRDDFDED